MLRYRVLSALSLLLLAGGASAPALAGINGPSVHSIFFLPDGGCTPGAANCRSEFFAGQTSLTRSESGTAGGMPVDAAVRADLAAQDLGVSVSGGAVGEESRAIAGYTDLYLFPAFGDETEVDWSISIDGTVLGANAGVSLGTFSYSLLPNEYFAGVTNPGFPASERLDISFPLEDLFNGVLSSDGTYNTSGTITMTARSNFVGMTSSLEVRSAGADIDFFNSAGYRLDFDPLIAGQITRESGLALQPVPLPGALWLLAAGAGVLGCWRRRRR